MQKWNSKAVIRYTIVGSFLSQLFFTYISFLILESSNICQSQNSILYSDITFPLMVVIIIIQFSFAICCTRKQLPTNNWKEWLQSWFKFMYTPRVCLLKKSLYILLGKGSALFVVVYILFNTEPIFNLKLLCSYFIQISNFIP